MVQTENIISLTGDQLTALDKIGQNTSRFFLLKGSAGVGKTTVIGEYCNRNSNVLLTAPTHKATEVLRSKSNKVECRTIHSFLGLKRKLIGKSYKFLFDIRDLFKVFDPPSTLIVDEASMINSELLGWIEQVANEFNITVIFSGDEKQLNPVEEDNSPVFHRGYPEFELTEIIRHQNDIIQLSRNLDWLYEKRNGKHFGWPDKMTLDMLIEANGTDKAKFITWTNEVVAAVNKQVRTAIYGAPKQFEVGETILMKEPFENYKNNEEVGVFSVEPGEFIYDEVDIPYKKLKTWIVNEDLILINDLDAEKHRQNVENLKQKAIYKQVSWYKYYRYLESFAKIQYNHAVTCYRSQGSSYGHSFVHITDMMRCPNRMHRKRMLYTAITRAKEYNHLI